MTVFKPVSRRLLLVSSALLVGVSLTLLLGVIGAVEAEFRRGATPEKAVTAFWVNIGLTLLLAGLTAVVAVRSAGPRWISVTLLTLSVLFLMGLGLALADAGSAYRSHGPQMGVASTLLFVCSAADLVAAALVVTATVLRPTEA